eukprot:45096-Eustigmatos_ZCMA.PRE.1
MTFSPDGERRRGSSFASVAPCQTPNESVHASWMSPAFCSSLSREQAALRCQSRDKRYEHEPGDHT